MNGICILIQLKIIPSIKKISTMNSSFPMSITSRLTRLETTVTGSIFIKQLETKFLLNQ